MELRELFPSNFYNLHQFCHLKVAWDVLIVYGKFFFTLDFPLKLFLFLYFILCTSKTSTTYLSIPSTYLLILVQILKSFLKGFHDPCFWTFDWNENEMLLHFEEEREKKFVIKNGFLETYFFPGSIGCFLIWQRATFVVITESLFYPGKVQVKC